MHYKKPIHKPYRMNHGMNKEPNYFFMESEMTFNANPLL